MSTLPLNTMIMMPVLLLVTVEQIKLRCQHVAYPNHPHSHYRKQCKQPLMKICKSKSTTFLRPFKNYCHKSIIKSLRMLLARPNFLQNCEQWRQCEVNTELLGDIYDGKVWKEFLDFTSRPCFKNKNLYNFAFSLNIDWFQPYKHVTDSVGEIKLSVLNLPRNLCYKVENIILHGIIPGSSEPKHVNNYIYPLLMSFFNCGKVLYLIQMKTEKLIFVEYYRLASNKEVMWFCWPFSKIRMFQVS